jgi:copper(I)-binding protein
MIAAAALLALSSARAAAQGGQMEATSKDGSIVVTQSWTRATPNGAKVAGGFLTVTNKGAVVDRLVGGSAAISGRIEIHEMSMSDGIMKMRELSKGLEIKPGQTVELKPGGYHIMLMDLKQAAVEGGQVAGTLVFEKAGTVEIVYAVRALGAAAGQKHSP